MKQERLNLGDYDFTSRNQDDFEKRGRIIFRHTTLSVLSLHFLFSLLYRLSLPALLGEAVLIGIYVFLLTVCYSDKKTENLSVPAFLVNLYPFISLISAHIFQGRLYENQYFNEIVLSLLLITSSQFLDNRVLFRTILTTALLGWTAFLTGMGVMILHLDAEIVQKNSGDGWSRFLPYVFFTLSIGMSSFLSLLNLFFRMRNLRQMNRKNTLFELITREMKQGLFLLDVGEKRIQANPSFYQIIDLESRTGAVSLIELMKDTVYPDDLPRTAEVLSKLEENDTEDLPLDIRVNHGETYRWIRIDGVFTEEGGGTALFLGTLTDIDNVKKQAQRIDAAFRASRFIPWKWDREKGIADFDPHYADILKIPAVSYRVSQKEFFYRMVHREDRARVLRFFSSQTIKGREQEIIIKAVQFRVRFDEKDDYNWIEGQIMGIEYDCNGFPLIIDGIFRNITAEKKRDLALEEEKKEREIADTKNRILSTLSHELLTPMNGVIGTAEQLNNSVPDRNQKKLLEQLDVSSGLLLGRIHELLDISELGQGEFSLHRELFSPEKLLKEIAESQKSAAQAGGVELILKKDDSLPPLLKGDRTRIGQIIGNLVKNGIKFTPRGKVTLAAEADNVTSEGCRLIISVADEGIGIPSEKLAAIFEPFTRLDSSLTREQGGFGLGLAITKQLTELMGGVLSVKSSPGKGSLFSVNLPLEIGKGKGDTRKRRPHAYPGSIALVVDDNPINREIAADLLSLRKIEVITAAGGQEGLDAIAQIKPHLVFMDIQMPGMDGYTATKLQREREEGKSHIPIIALTANRTEQDLLRAYNAGMDGFLTKPIDMSIIDESLDKWLREFRSSREEKEDREETEYPPIPGVDMEETLERLSGEYELLKLLLNDYLEDYRDFGEKLVKLEEKGDQEEMYARIHALKGVSGSLGIVDVYGHSRILAEQYREVKRFDGGELKALRESMENFREKLVPYLQD